MIKKLLLPTTFIISGYFVFLAIYPSVFLSVQAYSASDVHLEQPKLKINTVTIPKIDLQETIYEGADDRTLDKGMWHKYANRNPESGGNFLLLGHRFNFGLTPGEIKRKSPLYNIDKITVGDEIDVSWNAKKYRYKITDKKQVDATAVEIENNTKENMLTLYTCTLSGKNDKRVVLIAKPIPI
jgi:sortase A